MVPPGALGRLGAGALLLAALLPYYIWRRSLPGLSLWWAVAFASFVLIPAVFALVWCVLPLRRAAWLLPAGLAGLLLAFGLEKAGVHIPANFVKLGAMTALAFWFLGYFETVAWVALVALIVPWVDAYSVWRGPTHHIVLHHEHVFDLLSFAFVMPGHTGALRLGVPDILFFGLFLAAAARFRLRIAWTWLALCASFGATIAITVGTGLAGLPALPGLSLGFFLPNVDLIWRAIRRT